MNIEFELKNYRGIVPVNTSDSIASFGNHTVATYVDENYIPRVLLFHSGNLINDSALFMDYKVDRWKEGIQDKHQLFSISFDKWGYIWVVGDMHNYHIGRKREDLPGSLYGMDIMLWRSESPYDVTKFIPCGFGFPGNGFSYCKFRICPFKNDLYLSCRHHNHTDSSWNHLDLMGFGLYKLDYESLNWDPIRCNGHKSLFWNHGGYYDQNKKTRGPYQKFAAGIDIDEKGGIHAVAVFNNNPNFKAGCTLQYKYSPDQGYSWHNEVLLNDTPLDNDCSISANSKHAIINCVLRDSDYSNDYYQLLEFDVSKKDTSFNQVGLNISHGATTILCKKDIKVISGHHPHSDMLSFYGDFPNGIERKVGATSFDREAAKKNNIIRFWDYNREDSILSLKSITAEEI